ncbi:hypothetical protein Pelo_1043 [Pelomyxa schiedti]|nr:hypothetical protein Pelo_1043 [Pelomyxa schiedti]
MFVLGVGVTGAIAGDEEAAAEDDAVLSGVDVVAVAVAVSVGTVAVGVDVDVGVEEEEEVVVELPLSAAIMYINESPVASL